MKTNTRMWLLPATAVVLILTIYVQVSDAANFWCPYEIRDSLSCMACCGHAWDECYASCDIAPNCKYGCTRELRTCYSDCGEFYPSI